LPGSEGSNSTASPVYGLPDCKSTVTSLQSNKRSRVIEQAAVENLGNRERAAVNCPKILEDVMRVLLIGQDAATAARVKMILIGEKFICDTTNLGEDGWEIRKLDDYDAILVDLTVPNLNGYGVLRRLREAHPRTPVLILAGLAELDPRIKGLGFGDDDFITKPFDHRQLSGRIQAIARRSKGHCESRIQTGKLVVNLDTREVSVDNHSVHLTSKEYGILELLSLRKSTTLTKEMFLNHLYRGLDEPELKIIDVFVCKLRKKLARATGGNHYIETIWGRGYRLRDPDLTERPAASSKFE
jgi:two-component system, cell cycle response regulator CtrA